MNEPEVKLDHEPNGRDAVNVKRNWIDGIIDDVARDMERLLRDAMRDLTNRIAEEPKPEKVVNDPKVEPTPANGGRVLVLMDGIYWWPTTQGWSNGLHTVGWPRLCAMADAAKARLTVFDERAQ